MDPGPCFSHLDMQRSLPTNTQQRSRHIAAPPKGNTCQRWMSHRNVSRSQIWISDTVNTCHSCRHTGVPRLYGLTYKGRSEEGISVVSP